MESFLQGLTASYTNEKVALSSADWRAPSSFRSAFLQRKWGPRGARVCRPESGSTGLVFPQEWGDAVPLPVLPTSRMRNRHHLDSAPPRLPETELPPQLCPETHHPHRDENTYEIMHILFHNWPMQNPWRVSNAEKEGKWIVFKWAEGASRKESVLQTFIESRGWNPTHPQPSFSKMKLSTILSAFNSCTGNCLKWE